MSIDWNWGIFLQEAPFGNTTYLGWLWSGFQVTVALSITAWIIAFLAGSISHFTYRSQPFPLRTGHVVRRTVP